MDQTSTIPSFFAPQPAAQGAFGAKSAPSAGTGAISGGLLRPGAIDQPRFQAMLKAAQAAQNGGLNPQSPPDRIGPVSGIPTLTPAQFAVLTGGEATPAPATPDAQPEPAAESAAPTLLVSGIPTAEVSTSVGPTTDPAESMPADSSDTVPAARTADPRVVHFKRLPDQDERRALAASGKRWVVDETPGSRKLFFGDDEVFGWDDFVDLINPLQHIPIVAQLYRAISGDEISGAAAMLGAVPFGPTGVISAVVDLAVRDVTGKDIGDNVVATLFGPDDAASDGAVADAAINSAGAAVQTAARDVAISSRGINRDNGGRES